MMALADAFNRWHNSEWDTRKFKQPLAVVEGLPSLNDETNVIFSPDDRCAPIWTESVWIRGSDPGVYLGIF
jgi:hypothetical protein